MISIKAWKYLEGGNGTETAWHRMTSTSRGVWGFCSHHLISFSEALAHCHSSIPAKSKKFRANATSNCFDLQRSACARNGWDCLWHHKFQEPSRISLSILIQLPPGLKPLQWNHMAGRCETSNLIQGTACNVSVTAKATEGQWVSTKVRPKTNRLMAWQILQSGTVPEQFRDTSLTNEKFNLEDDERRQRGQ